MFDDRVADILASPPAYASAGNVIGHSRERRPIKAFRFGRGDTRISLLAGCHADEPVGPRLLRQLTAYLSSLPSGDPMLERYEWWVVPNINPDGEERNRAWQTAGVQAFKLGRYLAHTFREPPGDDIEFGFPRDKGDPEARPENRAVYDWWAESDGAFALHVSLHGMGFAAGPWFLIEEAWKDRCELLTRRCTEQVKSMGYVLHDVERNGEKGFFRLGRGYCTRPDSRYMREHFLGIGDEKTAELFRPSSMETMRSLGGDTLTLVSEMPLFITPGVGERLGPPDPVAAEWKERTDDWKAELRGGTGPGEIDSAAEAHGLSAMPVRDQMILQWTFIAAGLAQIESEIGG
jgi:hypothetical protein